MKPHIPSRYHYPVNFVHNTVYILDAFAVLYFGYKLAIEFVFIKYLSYRFNILRPAHERLGYHIYFVVNAERYIVPVFVG